MVDELWSLYQLCSLPPRPRSKCIRVLDILAPSPSLPDPDNDPIQCNLRVIKFDAHPFTALSYVWGAYNLPPDFITCNGVQIQVTNNCFSALKHLRKKLGTFTIWLDAVCINQDDQVEKSRQIPLMGDIYSRAHCVYVWLGEGSISTDRAMAYMANAGFQAYYKETSKNLVYRPWSAAFSLHAAKWSVSHHPIPFTGKCTFYLHTRYQRCGYSSVGERSSKSLSLPCIRGRILSQVRLCV
jgi:hypothetical protein